MGKSSVARRLSAGSAPGRQRGRRLAGIVGGVGVVLLLAVCGAVGMSLLEGRVLSGQAVDAPVRLRARLSARPDWMPQDLADQIVTTMLPTGASYYDRQLTDNVRSRAMANPWIRKVLRVSKYPSKQPGTATVSLDAEFRMPIAKAEADDGYVYLDAEGYRLPARQVPQWAASADGASSKLAYYIERGDIPAGLVARRIHYIVVQGAEARPPAVGRQWPGDDMAAGLALVCLVATKPYAYQITAVDVRNFGGRIDSHEPQLRLWAQLGRSRPTDIRFGRFPRPDGDYVVSPQRKMSYLDQYVEDHGRLAGVNRYLDLRYDELRISVN